MPTYEYRCPKCGHEFECFQRMSDPPVAPCPECETDAERLLSGGAGLLFKGDGFYITDYRSESYKKGADRDSKKETSSSDNGSSSKKDAGSSSKTSGSSTSKGDG